MGHHVIVGLGAIAHAHATGLRRCGQAISAVSADPEKRRLFLTRYQGIREFETLAEALADPAIQSVVICLPTYLHEQASVAAIRAGRHVLVEKPLAHSAESAGRIAAAYAEAHATTAFMVAEQMHFLPVLRPLARFAGAEGVRQYRIVATNTYIPTGWRTNLEQSGGGVALDFGIHHLSLAQRAFGPVTSLERRVLELVKNTSVSRIEEITVRHASGLAGSFRFEWAGQTDESSISVEGVKSRFRYRFDSRWARWGSWPVPVCLRDAGGRMAMVRHYVRAIRANSGANDLADGVTVALLRQLTQPL